VNLLLGSGNLDGREDLVAGDALTGKTLATFAPPARTTFQNATAAADDRTFVVFAVTTSATSFVTVDGDMLTGTWYKVSLAPGTAGTVRLSRLPIESWSWTGSDLSVSSPGQVYATALSQSGQELAVADVPRGSVAGDPDGRREVPVFSVATGRLLYDWTAADPSASTLTVEWSARASSPRCGSRPAWSPRASPSDADRGRVDPSVPGRAPVRHESRRRSPAETLSRARLHGPEDLLKWDSIKAAMASSWPGTLAGRSAGPDSDAMAAAAASWIIRAAVSRSPVPRSASWAARRRRWHKASSSAAGAPVTWAASTANSASLTARPSVRR
jgi:hypothetical protein